jgi:siroheme synthase
VRITVGDFLFQGARVARTAKVYLVGAGSGDPDPLTLKALRLLEQGQQEDIQSEIFEWILKLAGSARSIVRLKSGDPMVFGRGGEELQFLTGRGIDAEVVPGLSSALAAPALAGIPVTLRGVAAPFPVESTLALVARGKTGVKAPVVLVIGEVVRHRVHVGRALLKGIAA